MNMTSTTSPRRASAFFIILLIGMLALMFVSPEKAFAAGGEDPKVAEDNQDKDQVKEDQGTADEAEKTEEAEGTEDDSAASVLETISNAPIAETISQVADEGENAYYELKLGNQTVARFGTEKEANDVIKTIEDHFAHSDYEGAEISIEPTLSVEKVWLESADSEMPALDSDINQVITTLVMGEGERVAYFTGADETLWDVAQAYGVDLDELIALNPNIDPEVISEGTRVIVSEPEPLVKVKVEYDELVEKKIKYKTVNEETAELPEGETSVYQEGVAGVALATDHVVLVNGKETSREEVSREVVQEPVNKIVLVGAGEEPAAVEEVYEETEEETYTEEEASYEETTVEEEEDLSFANAINDVASAINSAPVSSTGFIWPLSGTVTYGFGYRSAPAYGASSYHQGIDICAAYGTPIVAAASGTTTGLTGWYDGYGLAVVIDHGNGLVTVYGHCSSLAVSAGQYVEQGQIIGYVGSTGISSANHCHFEVRANGTPVDPYNYL